jgi:hypothetical protein
VHRLNPDGEKGKRKKGKAESGKWENGNKAAKTRRPILLNPKRETRISRKEHE